jgi:hypothetical protein
MQTPKPQAPKIKALPVRTGLRAGIEKVELAVEKIERVISR